MIERPLYLDKLFAWKDKDVIKVITGIRRCGKSKILESYADKLQENGITEEQIVSINFEEMDDDQVLDAPTLHKTIEKRLKENKGKMTYVFLDEVQKVPEWEKAVASLRLKKNIDIYLTGSNAYMLSSELATYLSGRYIEIKMYPLSFKEFLTFHTFPENMSVEKKLALYMKFGGMPALKDYNFDENQAYDILDGIYNTVLVKDIAARSSGKNTKTIEKIIRFLADNIANMTSTNKITNTLYAEKSITSKNNLLVEEYLTLFEKAFIFYSVQRYDIKGKDFLRSMEKYYIADTGLRYRILHRVSDNGRLLENIVYFELLRRGYQVAIGKFGDKEVDFVATKQDKKIYIQVNDKMDTTKTYQRELSVLQQIHDSHRKIILTTDELLVGTTEDGINILSLIDWLLK